MRKEERLRLKGLSRSTLVEAVMARTQLEFPSEHAIRAWAVKHSVFLLSRFHFHHTLRSTPFFALNGYNYTGKLLCFGEVAEAGKERRGTLDQRCLVGKEQPGCQYFGNKGWNLRNVLSEEKRRTMGERIDLCFGQYSLEC